MTKQKIAPNQLFFSGKASDIKKTLQKLILSTNSRETVTEYTHRSAEAKR